MGNGELTVEMEEAEFAVVDGDVSIRMEHISRGEMGVRAELHHGHAVEGVLDIWPVADLAPGELKQGKFGTGESLVGSGKRTIHKVRHVRFRSTYFQQLANNVGRLWGVPCSTRLYDLRVRGPLQIGDDMVVAEDAVRQRVRSANPHLGRYHGPERAIPSKILFPNGATARHGA